MLEVCRQLKYDYFTYYYNLSKDQCETNHWIADRGTMFARHDAFIQRCEDLLHLCKTAQPFEKMGTVVIGGNSGAGLTNDIEGVFKEYNKIFDKMKSCGYDCLDVDETKFESDILKFSTGVKELEVRIAKVLGSGFEEAVTVSSGFKLVDSFGEMLERDFVQSDLESKKLKLILIYADELKEVQELVTRDKTGVSSKGKFFEREGPPLYTNMPPVSGALAWVQGLIHRLQDPMKALMGTLQKMEDTDEVEDVKRMHGSILASLVDYEGQMFQAWDGTVDKMLGDKLTLPLLVKDERSQEITVYFDQELLKLLNECKYLTLQEKDIPQIAKELFKQAEIFRVQAANLTLVQNMYNEMLRKMLDVEKPLLKAKMKAIDKVLARGLKDLVWQSPNADKDAFITEVNALVVDAHTTLFQMKANMDAIIAILNKWIAAPLMTRSSLNKTYNLAAYMEDHARYLEARQKDVADTGKEIHSYLKASNEVLKVSKGAPAWRAYVEFINGILFSGIVNTVVASLGYLLSQIDPKQIDAGGKSPFFDVKLDLNPAGKGDDAVFFSPPLDGPASMPSVMGYVRSIISDFYSVVKFVKRLDRAEGDFLKEMEENESVRFHVHRIVDECETNKAACIAYKQMRRGEPGPAFWDGQRTMLNKTLSDKYLEGGKAAGSQLIDQHLPPRIDKATHVASTLRCRGGGGEPTHTKPYCEDIEWVSFARGRYCLVSRLSSDARARSAAHSSACRRCCRVLDDAKRAPRAPCARACALSDAAVRGILRLACASLCPWVSRPCICVCVHAAQAHRQRHSRRRGAADRHQLARNGRAAQPNR